MRFDRDPALAFQIHRVEQLVLLVALVDRARALEQTVRQRRLAVIDVRDDAKIACQLNCHPERFRDYAGGVVVAQASRLWWNGCKPEPCVYLGGLRYVKIDNMP